MKFLIDSRPAIVLGKQTQHPDLVSGQLLTPLTGYSLWGGDFAIDNGAFSGFPEKRFMAILKRSYPDRERCHFVCSPDVVSNARRTLEAFDVWCPRLEGWPIALVAQDGLEDLTIPWKRLNAIFIGGTTEWKMSQAATDIIKTAQLLGIHTHVGRINTPFRFIHFHRLGVNTCDGSGVSRYDAMLENIAVAMENGGRELPLLDQIASNAEAT